jgi:glycosyltransferase involved in cell wall biosynthesis
MTMRIHQMTATLSPGDAIGNYVLTLRRIFAELGVAGDIFADHVHPALSHLWKPSSEYRPTGHDVLWFHYSIGADNFRSLENNPDRLVMDFHGVTPPHLIEHHELRRLAQQALEALPNYADRFRLCIVHSDAGRGMLVANGYGRLEKVPYVVDSAHLTGVEDMTLSCLLSRLRYLLFVGRIVANKGILDLVQVFGHIKRWRPNLKLMLVGDTTLMPGYVSQVEAMIQRLGLTDDVLLTGKVPDEMLVSFYRHAALLVTLSEHEMFGVPVIESLYYGVPVVCNDVPALREAAGEAGMVVQAKRHLEAAQAIHALLEDRERYEQLRAAGRVRALQFMPEMLRARIHTLLPLIVGENA